MGWLDEIFRKIGLVTVPPDEQMTLTWDFVSELQVIMPKRCSGDPAHSEVAVEKQIPGKRSKPGERKWGGTGCVLGALANLILLPLGFFFLPRFWSQETLKLKFARPAPYCAECYRGMRRTNTAQAILIVLFVLAGILGCVLPPLLLSSDSDPMVLIQILVFSLLGLAFLISLPLFGSARKRSHTIRIMDFEPMGQSTKITLRFHSRDYANLFLLENDIQSLLDPRSAARERAARELGQLHSTRATLPLVDVLADSDRAVRQAAVQSLIQLNDPAAIEPLVQSLEKPNVEARLAALEVLKQLEGERATAAMVRVLSTDESPQARLMAAEVLASTCKVAGPARDERVTEALARALTADRFAQVRLVAAEALASAGEVAVNPLIAALQDADASVRTRAARSLADLRARRAASALIATLGDQAIEVRQTAAGVLGELGDPVAIDPLIRLMQDESGTVRQAAARSLIAIAPDQSLFQTLYMLVHGDVDRRVWAATALGTSGDVRVVPALQRTLYDQEPVRQSAARALVGFGSAVALEPLLAALAASEPDVRATAAQSLGSLGSNRAEPSLLQALRDPSAAVRESAATALVDISDPAFRPVAQAIWSLIAGPTAERQAAARQLEEWREPRTITPLTWALLNDEDTDVRIATAGALSRLNVDPAEMLTQALGTGSDAQAVRVLVTLGRSAVPSLIQAAQAGQGSAQRAAISALGQIGDDRAVDSLLAALRSKEGQARLMAVQALGKMPRDSRIVSHLIQMLQDMNWEVQKAAVQILGQSGDARAVEPLVQALDHAQIRDEAGQALTQLGNLATEALLARYRSEKNKQVRSMIGDLLGDKKPPSLKDKLFRR